MNLYSTPVCTIVEVRPSAPLATSGYGSDNGPGQQGERNNWGGF